MNIVLIGPQGSGKSTQGKKISEDFNIPYISTGDMFREIQVGEDEFSISIREKLSKGELIDDETTNKIVRKHLEKSKFYHGFVIDGYPRSINQSMSAPFVLDLILHIAVPNEESVDRLLKRGRADDVEDNIRKRLGLYYAETEPILEYWREVDKVIDINGIGSVTEVHEHINTTLTNILDEYKNQE